MTVIVTNEYDHVILTAVLTRSFIAMKHPQWNYKPI